jgi:hypothetical protein
MRLELGISWTLNTYPYEILDLPVNRELCFRDICPSFCIEESSRVQLTLICLIKRLSAHNTDLGLPHLLSTLARYHGTLSLFCRILRAFPSASMDSFLPPRGPPVRLRGCRLASVLGNNSKLLRPRVWLVKMVVVVVVVEWMRVLGG